MRKLVLILLAFIAVLTFIRAYDNSGGMNTGVVPAISESFGDMESSQ